MDSRKSSSSNSDEKQDVEKPKYTKNRGFDDRCLSQEYGCGAKVKICRPSMIPIMRNEKIDAKTIVCRKRPTSSSKSLSVSKADRQKEDYDYKLKVLKEKEKSIAEYYLKIEEMIQKSMNQKRNDCCKKINTRKYEDSFARKMTSDPSMFSKSRIKSEISDFENNIQQISNIWLKTTSDLSSTIKNLKSNSRVDPIELQMENIRIQLAIKQAKSLTLVKTRSVIAEAKKLFRNREIIRSELENLLNYENLKSEPKNSQIVLDDMEKTFNQQNSDEQGMDGTGDSLKDADADSLENCKDSISDKLSNKEIFEREGSVSPTSKNVGDNISEKETDSAEMPFDGDSSYDAAKIISEMEILKKELTKKNKTITNLNKKIFDLQKTCNENSAKYNQLQVKLFEFHEKIQWNQVLWKQIGKLKERIKGLQLSNNELEFQKKELEAKIIRREQEIDRLLKLNHILNQKKQLLNAQEITVTECRGGECKHGQSLGETSRDKCCKKGVNKIYVDEKVITEKQTAINQLKKILNVMKDQENFAQKQISMFQSRIEELEKNGKA